jgi:hypothetical protein
LWRVVGWTRFFKPWSQTMPLIRISLIRGKSWRISVRLPMASIRG